MNELGLNVREREMRAAISDYYKSVELEPMNPLGKLALGDTNESLGRLPDVPWQDNDDWGRVIEFRQSIPDWLDQQEGIEKGGLDGGIIGVGAGNILTMLDVFAAIQDDPQAMPEFLIGMDIDPRAVLGGEVMKILILDAAHGARTREQVIKLLFGSNNWDEESRQLLNVQPEDDEELGIERLEPILKEALARQPNSVKAFFTEQEDLLEKTMNVFARLRTWGVAGRNPPPPRSITQPVGENIFNHLQPSISVGASLYRNFDKLERLAVRGDLHFVYGSIKDEKFLAVLAQQYPEQRNNLMYETNVMNIIERDRDPFTPRAEIARQLHFHELEKTFNKTGKGVHVLTNDHWNRWPNERLVNGYELVATTESPGAWFSEFYAS
ncbi:hypothetical protein A2368_03205 [Candidatus Collierbacteria bacterium RIFOXYB1_FULL_49_13]|uniref:Uncharacterized protein n=1 Tax=Candidatus Collierbacteria bacterium RIFOXYB1_FULL_49_13 TaxID=1817728 RepID=A0A1F5FJZ0_9BACT|nr:MAG: hypothetical protein A2368_03205 [Candidatus Collierbacteria bacterium RIFOXYB1_FULL_49_13]